MSILFITFKNLLNTDYILILYLKISKLCFTSVNSYLFFSSQGKLFFRNYYLTNSIAFHCAHISFVFLTNYGHMPAPIKVIKKMRSQARIIKKGWEK